MCGISGIVSYEARDLQEPIARMVTVMHHRGPDGQGTFVAPTGEASAVALGHNRLSIIDLTDHASQPMRSRDGRYVLVYNGEVYNYKEVAQELDARELPAPGFGDTAIVLAALIKWGPAALAKFNGMWGLLLYDAQEQTLLVSRDRLGVKPLYYYRDTSTLYLASEIKAILTASGCRLPVNPRTAVPYLTRGLLNFSDETFFAGIKQFPPASYQIIDLRRPQAAAPIERYWRHPFENGEHSTNGCVTPEELRSIFLDAVKLRLRSDVPLGVLLSGGVDSSAIVGGIAQLTSLDNLSVLSVTSDDKWANEEPFIDLMARHVNLQPQKINVSRDPLALEARLSDACWFNDEPVCGIADIAHLRLMERARAMGIKVLLSGQGADEQLGGYNKFLYFWLMSQWRQGRYVSALKTLGQSAIHSHTLYEFRLSEAIRYFGNRRLASHAFVQPQHQHQDDVQIGLGDSYAQREWVDMTKTSVPALLHYEDRMSMSQSLEIRVPFLDFRLVECLARVPAAKKFEGGWSKAIFRKAIEGLVPKGIQYRRDKKGFTVPEDGWMKHELRSRTLDMFRSPMQSQELGLVDSPRLLELFERFLAGRSYLNGRHFFRVYAFETFVRRFAGHIRADEHP